MCQFISSEMKIVTKNMVDYIYLGISGENLKETKVFFLLVEGEQWTRATVCVVRLVLMFFVF